MCFSVSHCEESCVHGVSKIDLYFLLVGNKDSEFLSVFTSVSSGPLLSEGDTISYLLATNCIYAKLLSYSCRNLFDLCGNTDMKKKNKVSQFGNREIQSHRVIVSQSFSRRLPHTAPTRITPGPRHSQCTLKFSGWEALSGAVTFSASDTQR